MVIVLTDDQGTLDAHSVLPLVEDQDAPGRYSAMHWQWQNGWMVRQGNWKLIQNGILGLGRTWTAKSPSGRTMPRNIPKSSGA